MKIHVLSDIHWDHYRNCGQKLDVLKPVSSDLLVLAGDLANGLVFNRALADILDRVGPSDYVVVKGNHDYWESDEATLAAGSRWHRHPLGSPVSMVGATFWTAAYERPEYMRDFYYHSPDALYRAHLDDAAWIASNHANVVVTHFMPDMRLVDPRYAGDSSNEYYAHDKLLVKPKLWIYGHTHTATDRIVDGVRCVCNPLGYPGEKTGFDPEFTVEV